MSTFNKRKSTVTCESVQDQLSPYIDGELSELERELTQSHLLECRVCRKELNQLKVLDWNLRFEDEIDIPNELVRLREESIDKLFVEKNKVAGRPIKHHPIIEQQQKNWKQMTRFMEYLPGKKILQQTGEQMGSKINQQLSTTSKKLLKKMIGF
ncbi:anti-sigma factor family protein [Evansella tamaricis]|uniref:Zf-HC2 domain-containing protein n=1 Tax=Evansella tamaricis TaxID=2069301 RepID=A0ABS6JMM4_9BACI|nr:zf-HC2 domain-containing protein [Evansella tamaricis]MBU9714921.1 zf-HC2 domain-containing protein [Evansella tamaricis]